ncbi:MAG: 3-hydroxyacyl-ACP dehydratase FabZ [Proteobacteria bacterium]|nr:3-hydroxyacyl-ACP dehydratase FabZ [Pseudomonadota bacterium]
MKQILIEEILKLIPHRYPMMLVDKVINIEPNKSILALKNVTINEQFFVGHFPTKPVMPGVLIVEALAQSAAILAASGIESDNSYIPYFTSIEKFKFRKTVVPGDTLFLNVVIEKSRGNYWQLSSSASVDQEVVASGSISAMLVKS